jgi:acetate---CoA ligase (ADP-forming)
MPLKQLFNPESIVIVGISENPDNLARQIAYNLIRFGYAGKLYMVGRNPGLFESRPILMVDELPEGIDLAIILTPAVTVPAYLEACGKKKIPYAIIESGGFSEYSPEGLELEQQLLKIARHYEMHLVGPNCIGISNPDSGILTHFLPTERTEVQSGQLAIIAQSGGVILSCTDILSANGLGVSKTVSMGNKTDLSEADYVRYLVQDPDTNAVIMYLESVVDGRELVDLARTASKPLLVYKSNTNPKSARIAKSHTAALANDDRIVDAVFHHAGILRLHNFAEMVSYGKAFSLPALKGNRLAVFSRSGGYAIVAADLANEFGFDLPEFSPAVIEAIRPFFRASIINENNPLDLGTVFDFESYPMLIEACLKDMQPDAVMLIFNFRKADHEKALSVGLRLVELSQTYQTPIALVYFSEYQVIRNLQQEIGYPLFNEVYEAMLALKGAYRFNVTRGQDAAPGSVSLPEGSNEAVRLILRTCQTKNRQPQLHEALKICEHYQIPVSPWAYVHSHSEAHSAADELGFPLALKVVSGVISHKSDSGGLVLNIRNHHELAEALDSMTGRLKDSIDGFLLQKMVATGREVILGGKRDPAFGPIILLGLGGIFVEILRDSVIRLAPITRDSAFQMMRELKGFRLLEEARGQPGVDINQLADSLVRLSHLVYDFPEIQELDINPMILYPDGGTVVDARIFISADYSNHKNIQAVRAQEG